MILFSSRSTKGSWIDQVMALLRENRDKPRNLEIRRILEILRANKVVDEYGVGFGKFSVSFGGDGKSLSTRPLRFLLALLWLAAAVAVAGPLATFFFGNVQWRLVAVFAVPSVAWICGWLIRGNLEAQFQSVYNLTIGQSVSKEAYTREEILVHCLAGVWAIQSLPWWARYFRFWVFMQPSNDVARMTGRPVILGAIRVLENWELLGQPAPGARTHQASVRNEIDNEISAATPHLEKLQQVWLSATTFPTQILDMVGKPVMAFGGAGILALIFLHLFRP